MLTVLHRVKLPAVSLNLFIQSKSTLYMEIQSLLTQPDMSLNHYNPNVYNTTQTMKLCACVFRVTSISINFLDVFHDFSFLVLLHYPLCYHHCDFHYDFCSYHDDHHQHHFVPHYYVHIWCHVVHHHQIDQPVVV